MKPAFQDIFIFCYKNSLYLCIIHEQLYDKQMSTRACLDCLIWTYLLALACICKTVSLCKHLMTCSLVVFSLFSLVFQDSL